MHVYSLRVASMIFKNHNIFKFLIKFVQFSFAKRLAKGKLGRPCTVDNVKNL
jgi:hypothetical protein